MSEDQQRRHTLRVSKPTSSARKLAAIMFTDIVGYTSLMGEDEQKAFKAINTNREIHQRFIEQYHGKIVKELGDGLLSVFENGTEAVQCAILIQREANVKNIPLRIGIHEGEVVMENEDVFGDGVNIASRIQDEAARGGICISDSVYRIIKNKTDIKAESIGSRHLKNVDETIKLYQIKAIGINTLKSYSGLRRSKFLVASILLLAAFLLITGGWFLSKISGTRISDNIERFDINLPDEAPIFNQHAALPFTISPDGKLIVYQANVNGDTLLYKRYLNQDNPIPIPGTEGGEWPFFSPDGTWIAFKVGFKLKKVQVSGGNPVEICNIPSLIRGKGIWLHDNRIVSGLMGGRGLVQVPATGGEHKLITAPDQEVREWIHASPYCLPDNKTILYTVLGGSLEHLYIKSINLDNMVEKVIMKEVAYPMYISNGYLTYLKNNHLMASPFNLKELEIQEPELILIENIAFRNLRISLSDEGTLTYVPDQFYNYELVWVDMNGNIEPIIKINDNFLGSDISPDGNKIAISKEGQVYIYDIQREFFDKLTNSRGNYWPVWTPDGKQIAFPALRGEDFVSIYWKPIDKSTTAQPLLKVKSAEDMKDHFLQPQEWTTDKRFLLYVVKEGEPEEWDIMLMDLDNNNQVSDFIATANSERHPRLSPDNKWLAYQSKESGKYEIYVTKFPEKGPKWQISTGGGTDPLWSPEGSIIYYRNKEDVMAVDISTKPEFNSGKPEVLFSGKFRYAIWGYFYDIHPDGDKFVMVRGTGMNTAKNYIKVIRNFPKMIENKFAEVR